MNSKNMIGAGKLLAYKAKRWQTLHGTFIRRAVVRSLLFGIAISLLPLVHFVYDIDPINLRSPSGYTSDECEDATYVNYLVPPSFFLRVLSPVTPSEFPHLSHAQCKGDVNLTTDVVRELVERHLLNYGVKALYVGKRSASAVSKLNELGFAEVDGAYKHSSFFSLKQKQFAYELNYGDNQFDFVITRDLDKVSVPALLVNEVERVLKPGGLGAMLVGTDGYSSSSSLIRSAAPISSFLKTSNVIHVTSLHGFTLVTFKKRFANVSPFEQYHLPADCVSVRTNKPFLDRIEPLVKEKPKGNPTRIAYLPNLIDVSPKKRLVYIDMGAKASAEFTVGNWFLPSYPIDSKAFSVYIVDHDALVLSSHVKRPGVSFIYHPGLAGKAVAASSTDDVVTEDEDIPFEAEEFDFLEWFKETVEFSDFVVMKMKLGNTEAKFLIELFESGLICSVDEIFLQCSDSDGSDERGNLGDSCLEIFQGLRSSGVFVHQWWGKLN